MLVRLEHLDKLLNLAGEVIITSSTLHELERELNDALAQQLTVNEGNLQTIKAADEASRRISQDLHDLVMAIRMVEIGETFKLFRRPVRDLARALKKEIDLKWDGDKVLVDKALAERLVEPLLHLLRNAADHGIETPIERIRAKKKEQGTIFLHAIEHEHETELVISDDGRGINETAIFDRARRLGFVRPGETPDLLTVLCISGFSTRDKATDTSGRGVGLDLVRTMVDEFTGSIDLTNKEGEGCTLRLHIPKLKAVNIIDGLIVRCGRALFALSIDKVISLQGINPRDIHAAMDRDPFIRYLGEPTPLFDLHQLIGGQVSPHEKEDVIPIVVVEGKRGARIAVMVTEFLAPSKLVNVPLDTAKFSGIAPKGIRGTCIISGGRVGMTVDLDLLVACALGDPIDDGAEHDALSLSLHANDAPAAKITQDLLPSSSLPNSTTFAHSQEELINKAKLSVKRDAIANRLEDTGQKDLSAGDVGDLCDELTLGLVELQDNLLSLETSTQPEDLMKESFRRLHAAKGNFTMLGADGAAALAHQLETALDYLRKGRVERSQELMDVMLDGVGELLKVVKSFPNFQPPAAPILARLDAFLQNLNGPSQLLDPNHLLSAQFSFPPIVELQLLGALKGGAKTYETYVQFAPSHQAEYLLAYLMLRKLCYCGTILATLPSIGDIEEGRCGRAIKILWATKFASDEMQHLLNDLTPLYNIAEHQSIPTTVFRYDSAAEDM